MNSTLTAPSAEAALLKLQAPARDASDRRFSERRSVPAVSARGLEMLEVLNDLFDALGAPDSEFGRE